MDSHKLLKVYDGTTDVRKFVTRVELEASIKGHANEKKAQYIASKLVGHAMDVYLRMAADDQKDPDKVKGELMKEFERGQLNREEAISELDRRKRASGESAETFAYKVIELVKLAYPSFADDVRMSLAKDFFVRGLSSAMQVAVKSNKEFSTMDVKALATETVRLELAGVGGTKAPAEASINSCDEMVDAIAEKVLQRLSIASGSSSREEVDVDNVDGNQRSRRDNSYRNRSSGRQRGRGRGQNRGGTSQTQTSQRRCRSCKSTQHLIKDCPERYCQACGGRGHDQYNSSCPNFEQ
jgi:hypothetical protein